YLRLGQGLLEIGRAETESAHCHRRGRQRSDREADRVGELIGRAAVLVRRARKCLAGIWRFLWGIQARQIDKTLCGRVPIYVPLRFSIPTEQEVVSWPRTR